jgi:hypothetical protein
MQCADMAWVGGEDLLANRLRLLKPSRRIMALGSGNSGGGRLSRFFLALPGRSPLSRPPFTVTVTAIPDSSRLLHDPSNS